MPSSSQRERSSRRGNNRARFWRRKLTWGYAILPWSSKLRNGRALQERYGAQIGFRYYEDEDCGIFWSNDPATPVRRMVQALGLLEAEEELARVRQAYHGAGVLDY